MFLKYDRVFVKLIDTVVFLFSKHFRQKPVKIELFNKYCCVYKIFVEDNCISFGCRSILLDKRNKREWRERERERERERKYYREVAISHLINGFFPKFF